MARYNQPEKGTVDWHNPLNENFARLDTDIEIRDVDSNRGQYSPKNRAKFLATDTGSVYTGDGSSWNKLGEITNSNGSDGSGSIVATPGGVQEAIDTAANAGGGKVGLDSTQVYDQPRDPWVVKKDVVLDFDGARLVGTGDRNDTDIIHLYPGGQILNPRIDLYNGGNGYTPSNGYRARVFSLDTRWGFYFAFGTTIQNGYIMANDSTTTACYLGVNTEGPGSAITHLDLNYNIGAPRGFGGNGPTETSVGTALHMDTTNAGDDGYINGVRVSGNWRYVNLGVLQEGVVGDYNEQGHNKFYCQFQAADDYDAMWKIKDPTFAAYNMWRGMAWDYASDPPVWKIDSQYQDPNKSWKGCKANSVWTTSGPLDNHTRNKSPNDQYVNQLWNMTSVTV